MRGFILLLFLATLASCGSSGTGTGSGSAPRIVNSPAAEPPPKLVSSDLEVVHIGDADPPLKLTFIDNRTGNKFYRYVFFNNFYRETEKLQDNGEDVDIVSYSVRHHEFTATKVGCGGCIIYVPVRQSDRIGDGYMLYAENSDLQWSIWAGGELPALSDIPSGQHRYNGRLMFADRNSTRRVITAGTVAVTTNFDSKIGSVEGTTVDNNGESIYNLSGEFNIDLTDGSITSTDLTITDLTASEGQNVRSSVKAFMKGSFHGTAAQSVTGVVKPDYLAYDSDIIFGGAFIASRIPPGE